MPWWIIAIAIVPAAFVVYFWTLLVLSEYHVTKELRWKTLLSLIAVEIVFWTVYFIAG